jgi:hypothetical protein
MLDSAGRGGKCPAISVEVVLWRRTIGTIPRFVGFVDDDRVGGEVTDSLVFVGRVGDHDADEIRERRPVHDPEEVPGYGRQPRHVAPVAFDDDDPASGFPGSLTVITLERDLTHQNGNGENEPQP